MSNGPKHVNENEPVLTYDERLAKREHELSKVEVLVAALETGRADCTTRELVGAYAFVLNESYFSRRVDRADRADLANMESELAENRNWLKERKPGLLLAGVTQSIPDISTASGMQRFPRFFAFTLATAVTAAVALAAAPVVAAVAVSAVAATVGVKGIKRHLEYGHHWREHERLRPDVEKLSRLLTENQTQAGQQLADLRKMETVLEEAIAMRMDPATTSALRPDLRGRSDENDPMSIELFSVYAHMTAREVLERRRPGSTEWDDVRPTGSLAVESMPTEPKGPPTPDL